MAEPYQNILFFTEYKLHQVFQLADVSKFY